MSASGMKSERRTPSLTVRVRCRASGVLDEQHLARRRSGALAGGHLDLDLAVEEDDELTPRRAVPVEVVARVVLPEHDAGRGRRLGHPSDLARVGQLDLDVLEVRPTVSGDADVVIFTRRRLLRLEVGDLGGALLGRAREPAVDGQAGEEDVVDEACRRSPWSPTPP